ncbi:uncharacterized protein [Dermacentor andersoni]|uniref:uncharacterized protein n=1 Tax=Dermacentor andersoni TaxID=34620 RepID=UPI002417659F|nr:uncharacterized protein LOC129385251 [Dermacentor andersoni]
MNDRRTSRPLWTSSPVGDVAAGVATVADPVLRQAVLGLVVPGLLFLIAGTVCAFYAFLVGVSLVAFGAFLLLLPAAVCRILKSLPGRESPEHGSSKKERRRNIARDSRPTYGSRYSAAYVNPAFEPKETMGDDSSGYARVSSISCSSSSLQGLHKPPSQKPPCHISSAPRKYASTNSLAAELHEACRYQHSTKEPTRPSSHGFRHIEFDPESARFGEQPPRYSTVVRESPLI